MIDATNPIEFKVRGEDRKGADARNPERCVVARAARRSLKGKIQGIKIGASRAYVVDAGGRTVRYFLSTETREMVRAFDGSGYYPTGVIVRLIPPPAKQKLGQRKGDTGTKRNGKGKPSIRSDRTPWLRHIDQDPN